MAYQKKQTERLLQNILPVRIAERLKSSSGAIAENFDDVTVLFADIVGFTELSSQISPVQLVRLLNQIFSKFDALTEHHQLEKIKTIGDAYMVVGGLPVPRADHARAIAEIALDMLEATAQFNAETDQNFSIRIGIHTEPVVAGVIGTKKFIYDLWGDTVNTASRMESHGVAGCIQVSSVTYDLLQDGYELTPRGQVYIKGKGEMFTYFLLGKAQISP
uniref:Adenylate/guanylate cyclase domain-containing protein n=1 Tax=Desertifilum tharense IPPAS B-1220 TaxID=1781255 RepID=A0ACD5H335_9CYAN